MKFSDAIDLYITDARAYGRINSDRTEVTYRQQLNCHADDIGNRDPRTAGREDIKRTLARWPHPNTRRRAQAALSSFYDWAMEEGIRKDNPARQIRRPKPKETSVYRLTRSEALALMDACVTPVERRVIYIGLCAGLRNREMRGLKGEHFARLGYVWVSPNIAKGARERWVPVIPELEDVIGEIVTTLQPGEYVLAARRVANPPANTKWTEDPPRPASGQFVWRLVARVAKRAGIAAHIHPHLLRHAYGDHVARYAGLRAAQALLGHAAVDTTAGTYVDRPTLDELSVSVHGFSYRGYPREEHLESLSGDGGIRTRDGGPPPNDGESDDLTRENKEAGP